METIFRGRVESEESPIQGTPVKETQNIAEGKEDVAISGEIPERDQLSDWETTNGKYGAEYLGIREISKQFPYNAQFGLLDKYINEELSERGLKRTTEGYQSILSEIENEIGSGKLDTFERLKRLSDYVRVMKKFREAKKKREEFQASVFSSRGL